MNKRILIWAMLLCVSGIVGSSGLDTTFGATGIALAEGNSFITSCTVQPNGKIIAAGNAFMNDRSYFATSRYNSNGTLDSTFGTDGIVTTSIGNQHSSITGVTLQADGKIVAAGYAYNDSIMYFALARYGTDGTLDSTFGTDGIVITDVSGNDQGCYPFAVAVSGEKIVVGGGATISGNSQFAVARYNDDGTLDTSFGGGSGYVTTEVPTSGSSSAISALCIQPNGKILVGGSVNNSSYVNFALARYDTNGSLDTMFGSSGTVVTDVSYFGYDTISTVTVLTNGTIIAGGLSNDGTNDKFALAQYDSSGSLDSTNFGTGGTVTTLINSSDCFIKDLMVTTAGKIVVCGSSYGVSTGVFTIARYNSNGTLDTTFGASSGYTTTDVSVGHNSASSIVQLLNGSFVLAGGAVDSEDITHTALTNYSSNGIFNTNWGTFGAGTGIVAASFSEGSTAVFKAASQIASGKIVAVGYVEESGTKHYLVAQYNSDGSLDTSFGDNGSIVSGHGELTDLALQYDGKIVVAGSDHSESYNNNTVVLRYTSTGGIDGTFGSNGKVITDIGMGSGNNDILYTVTLQSDTKIVAGGQAGPYDALFVRYNSNGTLDTSFDSDGIKTMQFSYPNTLSAPYITSMIMQPNNKILAVANGNHSGSNGCSIVSLNTNGSNDFVQTYLDGELMYSVTVLTNDLVALGGTLYGSTQDLEVSCFATNSGGGRDTGFGSSGYATLNVLNNDNGLAGTVVDTYGRFVIAGSSNNGQNFVIARFTRTGALDTSFGGNSTGYLTTSGADSVAQCYSLFQQSDGKYVIAGTSGNPGKATLIRYSTSIN